MVSYEEFKRKLGVNTIKFRQSLRTKRFIADVEGIILMISKNGLKDGEPIYVTQGTTADTKEPCFVLCNQAWGEEKEI